MTTPDPVNQARGAAIKRRRLSHGFKSVREFAEQTGIDREALSKAERGVGSEGTYERLDAWLDNFEEEIGDDGPPQNDLVEFRLTGNFGVDVVVRGPVSDLAELEATVMRLMGHIGGGNGGK